MIVYVGKVWITTRPGHGDPASRIRHVWLGCDKDIAGQDHQALIFGDGRASRKPLRVRSRQIAPDHRNIAVVQLPRVRTSGDFVGVSQFFW